MSNGILGCDDPEGGAPAGNAARDAATTPDATTPAPDAGADASASARCGRNEVPLVMTRADGVADVQVVPVRLDGRDAWLALADEPEPRVRVAIERGLRKIAQGR